MDGGAWWAAVHGVTKSWTWLSDFTFPFHFHALEKEMATHSNVLAWRIPGTGEPGGLPSMGSHRVGHDWSDSAAAAAAAIQETQTWSLGREDPLEKGVATHSSILAWRSPWTEEPGGLQSIGWKRVGHNWGTFTFSPGGPVVGKLPASAGNRVGSLVQEDSTCQGTPEPVCHHY